jgi:DNA polymerase III sliding clamp (beta) subunit (PCNA family)
VSVTLNMSALNENGSAATVSAALLRHEAEFVATLGLPKNDMLLRNVLLEVESGFLRLTVTDGRASIITRVPVSRADFFVAAVDATKFLAVARFFKTGDMHVSFVEDVLQLQHGFSNFSMGHVPEAVEAIRSHAMIAGSGQTLTLKAGPIIRAVEDVVSFIPKKGVVLKGTDVCGAFLTVGQAISTFAIDGYYAIEASGESTGYEMAVRVFFPKNALKPLLNVSPAMKDKIFIGIHGTDLRIECAPRVILVRSTSCSKLGSLDIFSKIPEAAAKVMIHGGTLLNALRRQRLAWDGPVRPIELTTAPNKLILRVVNGHHFDTEEEVEAEIAGTALCTVNAESLLGYLRTRITESVELLITANPKLVQLSTGTTRFLVTCLPAAEVPEQNG